MLCLGVDFCVLLISFLYFFNMAREPGTNFIHLFINLIFKVHSAPTERPQHVVDWSTTFLGWRGSSGCSVSQTSELLVPAALQRDAAAQSAETNCFAPTLLHLLTSFSPFFSPPPLQHHLEHKQSARSHQSSRAWHPHRIGSFHRRGKKKGAIYGPLPMFYPSTLYLLLRLLCLSDFTAAAHQILARPFFDGGDSQDSSQVYCAARERAEREGQTAKLENSLSSFVLLHVRFRKRKQRKSKAGERKKEKLHSVFLNRLYESYQTTDWLRFKIGAISGDFSTNFSLPLFAPHPEAVSGLHSLVLSFHFRDSTRQH